MDNKDIDILFWSVKISYSFLIDDENSIKNLTEKQKKKVIYIRKFLHEIDRLISKDLKYKNCPGGTFELKNFCNLIKLVDYWMYYYSKISLRFLVKWKKIRKISPKWEKMVKN